MRCDCVHNNNRDSVSATAANPHGASLIPPLFSDYQAEVPSALVALHPSQKPPGRERASHRLLQHILHTLYMTYAHFASGDGHLSSQMSDVRSPVRLVVLKIAGRRALLRTLYSCCGSHPASLRVS